MRNNVIGQHIRRCNRNLLLFNSVLLASLLLWALASSRYLYNCVRGPLPVIDADLAHVADPALLRRYFVSVDGLQPVCRDSINKSRSGRYRRREHEMVMSRGRYMYLAAHFGKLIVIVRAPSAVLQPRYEAGLVPLPVNVRAWFERERPGNPNRGELLPYLLDATDFRRDARFYLALFGPIGVLAAFNVGKALRRMSDMETSPIYRQLQESDKGPETTAWLIDRELKEHKDASPIPSVSVTPSWLLQSNTFGLDIVRLKEVVWIYQTVTAFASTRVYFLKLADDRGRRVSVMSDSKERLASLMQLVTRHAPWAVTGFSRDLKHLYANDRASFLANANAQRKS